MATEQEIEKVRNKYIGQRVRLYGGLEITVARVETCPADGCYHFYAKNKPEDDPGYVTRLPGVVLVSERKTMKAIA